MKPWTVALAALSACLVIGSGLYAQETTRPKDNAATLSAADRIFLLKAAKGGMMEVKLGDIATKQAANGDVKQFGQRMVDDHSKAKDELKQLAAQKGVTLPTDIDSKQNRTVMRLSKLNGMRFDHTYVMDMVKGHQAAIRAFAREAKYGKDADVKAWAAKTLPTLKEHLKMAQGIQKTMMHTHTSATKR